MESGTWIYGTSLKVTTYGGGKLKKLITILIILAFTMSAYAETMVSLTDDQLKNLDLIGASVKTSYPSFSGFHGTKGEMIADNVGISSVALQAYVDGLDVTTLKKNDKKRKDLKKLRNKFKSLGFTDDELAIMGYVNDIPDTE